MRRLAVLIFFVACHSMAAPASFRGHLSLQTILNERVVATPRPLKISNYIGVGLEGLLGKYDGTNTTDPTFRNGTPNALSIALHYLFFIQLAAQVGSSCSSTEHPITLQNCLTTMVLMHP